MTKHMTRGEKAALRGVAHSHFDHVLKLLKERPPLFLEKARRSFAEGQSAFQTARPCLPRRSQEALYNRVHDVKARLERAESEWSTWRRDSGITGP